MKNWNKIGGSLLVALIAFGIPGFVIGDEAQKESTATTVIQATTDTSSTTSSSAESVGQSVQSTEQSIEQSTEQTVTSSDTTADISKLLEKEITINLATNPNWQLGQNQSQQAYVDLTTTLANQTHIIHSISNGWVSIQNTLTGNYLTTSGERAIYQKYDGSANQNWRIIDGQNGTFGIQSNTSQYLTVTNKNELVLNATKSNSAWKLALFVSKTESQSTTSSSSDVQGKITTYQQTNVPTNVITQTRLSDSKIKVTITNPNGGNAKTVKFPTWSQTNGQDDIRWVTGTKNSNGS